MSTTLKSLGAGLRALLVLTVLLGIGYPLVVTGIGQLAFNDQANGSLVSHDGRVVGSSLIGQTFTDEDGNPLPTYFQPRPSAAGDGYDPLSTSASNLGPNDAGLLKTVEQRRQAVAEFEGVDPSDVPTDAVTASGSGLDPHISPAYAELQVPRVARERGLSEAKVRALVDEYTYGRVLGLLGEPRVNVLLLNIALDDAADLSDN